MEKYYVIFDAYIYEDGIWNTDYEVYTKVELAHEFVKTLQNNNNYKNIIGPLVSLD
jgi:hypothetical protein